MQIDVKNKVVIVTGSTRGIGKEILLKFAKSGALVVVNYRKKSNFIRLKPELDKIEATYLGVKCDISKEKHVKRMIKRAHDKFGRIDVLVNNAGFYEHSDVAQLSTADWNKVLNTNLVGVFHCIREASYIMIPQKYGKIVNIASAVGLNAHTSNAAYAASKSAVINLTKFFAISMAPFINVNCVAPGLIDTDLINHFTKKRRDEASKNNLIKRLGKPSDIAPLVLFLSSDESRFINGQTIVADGGYSVKNGIF